MSHRLALALLAVLVALAHTLDYHIAAELAGETQAPTPLAAAELIGDLDGTR